MQIKRNHHYVWSHYLRKWASRNNIFYISKKGKISNDSVKGLAKETDFYQINLLNQADINFIKSFSSKSPQFLQDIHMSHLEDFIRLSYVSNSIRNSNIRDDELDNIDSVIRQNSLEDLHSICENLAVNVINTLAEGDQDVLRKKENMIAFCSYLGHQISRTKSFKDNSILSVRSNSFSPQFYPEHLKLMEKNWWFLSFMFGLSIGFSLYESKDRDNHVFITNSTDMKFITSDSPIVNVHKELDSLQNGLPPTYADFYIPLSPKYAYMINNSNDYNKGLIPHSTGLSPIFFVAL